MSLGRNLSITIGSTLAVIFAVTISACGPSQSARDQQLQQIRTDNRKTSDEYKIVIGAYTGTITTSVDVPGEVASTFQGELRIWLTTITSVSAGTSTPIEIPTLAASLTIHNPGLDDIESFSSGSYDQDTGSVTLYSPTSVGSSAGSVVFNLTYTGTKLTGEFCGTRCNSVNLTRVAQPQPKKKAPK